MLKHNNKICWANNKRPQRTMSGNPNQLMNKTGLALKAMQWFKSAGAALTIRELILRLEKNYV